MLEKENKTTPDKIQDEDDLLKDPDFFFIVFGLLICGAKDMIGEDSEYNSDLKYHLEEIAFEAKLSLLEKRDWQREKATNPYLIKRKRIVLVCRYAFHPDDIEIKKMLEDDINMESQTVDISSPIDSLNLSSSYLYEKAKMILIESKRYPMLIDYGASWADKLCNKLVEFEKELSPEERMTFMESMASMDKQSKNNAIDFLYRLRAGFHYVEDPTNPDTKKALKETIEKYSSSDVKEEPNKQKKILSYPVKKGL